MKLIKESLNSQTMAYLFFGVCTMVVNTISYYVCVRWLGFSTIAGTVTAWILAVVFAFVTNKLFVFESRSWKWNIFIKEAVPFFLCRIATGVLDVIIMFVGVDISGLFDLGVKVLANVLVIILNYVASRLLVFRNGS